MNRIVSIAATSGALLFLLSPFQVPGGRALAQGAATASLTTEAGSYELAGKSYPADVGTLTVPETRGEPDSRSIELPLIRIRATGDNPAEPIFVLAGGPGDSNVKWGDPTVVELLEHHEVVMVGYRGIDGLVSLDAPEVTEVYRTFTEDPLSGENLERLGQAYFAAFQRLQGEGIDMDSYTMIDVIDDFEDARVQLGYDRINLYGLSYGTRVAYLYGLRYPDSLHRSALLAVNPPGHFVWEPAGIDAQLRYYAELWQRDADAVARSPDIIATMRAVLATLPQQWQGFRIDPDKVKVVTHFQLFHRGDAAKVFDAYVAAEKGDYAGLAFLSVAFDQIIPTVANFGDRASKALSADFDADRDYLADMNPPDSILGSPLSAELGGVGDDSWPIEPIPEEYRTLRESEAETLLVNGSIDFSTPVENAQELLPFLPNGELVVLSEMGHTKDLTLRQPEALLHLLETFYLTGEVDASRFEYDPMNFTPDKTFQQMAEEFAARARAPEVPLEARLQATLDRWREANDVTGVTLAVSAPERGVIELASGLAVAAAGTAMTPDHRLVIASMTKTYVATVVLQLVDEGALTLDDTLSRWLPDFPNAADINVRQMLSHTSGATDYLPENRVRWATMTVERKASDWPGLTPDELIEAAAGVEPSFEPGTSFAYSNSNTVLLGRIIELLTGNPLHVELRSRLFEPLALERTFFAGAEAIPGDWGPGYATEWASLFGAAEPPAVMGRRMAALVATTAWASGALVATAGDVVRFEQALFGGELLEAATLAEMMTPSPVVANFVADLGATDIGGGLGVFMYPFPEPIGTGFGHDGGEPGFRSIMLTFPEHDISVSVLVNDGRPNFNIFPRGKDVDALVGEVVRMTLEAVTGTEIQLGEAATAEDVYQDPEGRFSMTLVGEWTRVETDGTYARFAYAEPPLSMYVATVESDDLGVGLDTALRQVGIDPAALTETRRTSLNRWNVLFHSSGETQGVSVLAQIRNGTSYWIIFTGDEALTVSPPEKVMATIGGFAFVGDEAVLPTTVSEFEIYINSFVGDIPPGLSIAIALGGDVIYANGFGMADGPKGMAATPETVFQWGSITKTVTATAIMQLSDQGLIGLDDPVSDYLDYFPAQYPITVRQLLGHSSGLPEPPGFVWVNLRLDGQPPVDPGLVDRAYYEQVPSLMFEPGSDNAYVNPDMVTLGQIVAEVSGQPYVEYVREHILAPLGMENTDFTYSSEAMIANAAAGAVPVAEVAPIIALLDEVRGLGDGADFFREADDQHAWMSRLNVFGQAGGGLIGPPTEAIRFAQMVLNGGEFDGVRVLSPESAALMQEVPLSTSGEPLSFGLAWHVVADSEHPYIEHDGGGAGITTRMRLYLNEGFAIVLMSNGTGFDRGEVTDAAANVVFTMLAPDIAAPASAPTESTAEDVYQDPEGRFTMKLAGEWTPVETDGTYARFAYADLPFQLSLVAVKAADLEVGVDAALRQVGVDPAALTLTQAGNTLGLWFVFFYSVGDGQGVAVLAQVRDDTTYAIIATGDEDVVVRAEPPGDVLDTIEAFAFAGEESVLPTTVGEFETYINSFVGDIPPGLSIAIALGGDEIYANGFGLADGPKATAATPNTVYQWGSMAKMVTATAILQLRDQGLIDLDANISGYLDYFPVQYPITVRQLLNHSAGFPEGDVALELFNVDGEPLPDPDLAARKYAEQFTGPIFEPGSTSAYANPHLLFLGQIVAAVSGQPYIAYAQENILKPLGMENTDFTYSSEAMIANAAAHAIPAALAEPLIATVGEVWKLGDTADLIHDIDDKYAWLSRLNLLAAWGGLKGSPIDVIRFLQMHLNGGELDGVRILSPESVAMMREVQLSTSGDPLEFTLGWRIGDDAKHPYVEHAGGGQGIKDLMRLYPNEGIAIVLMSNAAGYDDVAVVNAAANVVFTMLAP
ncbi:MAG: alpha/beta fold hydrolase [Hyphomicrobiales bacterium]|nr:alpha/beta fold hydrolase [Hyphomicrobiales bacterium]